MTAAASRGRHRIAAVIVREMRGLARYRTPFVLRTVYAALIAAPVAMMFANVGNGWSGEELANFGYQMFTILVWFQSFLALLLGALMGVVSVAVERRERTLGLVMLSQVKPAELVLGKLIALLALLSTVLLAGLPVYALVGWAGGVDYLWFAALVVLSVGLAVQGIAAGLVGGLMVRNGFGAVICAGTLLFGPMILGVIWLEATSDTSPDIAARIFAGAVWLTSAVAFQGADESIGSAVDVVTMTAMIAVLLLYAVQILPRAAAAREGSGLRGVFEKLDRFYEGINFGGIRFGRERRSVTGDPVSWLTRTTSGTALVRYGFRLAAAMTIVSLVSLPWMLFDGPIELAWFLFGTGLIVAMLALGATGLGDEKARRSLNVLLATPLTAAEIVHGKMRATVPAVLAVLTPAVVYLGFGLLVDPGSFSESAAGVTFLLAEGLCGYFLALYLSLHVATSLRAGIGGALTLAAVHVPFGFSAGLNKVGVLTVSVLALVAAAVSVGPYRPGKPAMRFTLLLLVAAVGLGMLWQWLEEALLLADSSPALLGLLLVVSLSAYLQTRWDFDRILGRTP